MVNKWTNWLIPGLMAMTHFSAAADKNGIDNLSADQGSHLEVEAPEESMRDEIPLEEFVTEDNLSSQLEVPKTRFGVGYEYRQSLRPDIFARPDVPEKPQRPERPDRPGRFGQ